MNYMTLTTFVVAIMKKIYTYEYKINCFSQPQNLGMNLLFEVLPN